MIPNVISRAVFGKKIKNLSSLRTQNLSTSKNNHSSTSFTRFVTLQSLSNLNETLSERIGSSVETYKGNKNANNLVLKREAKVKMGSSILKLPIGRVVR